jgi:hypothetical protein
MLAAGLLVGSAPAQAENLAGVAGLGWAGFTKSGQRIDIPAPASCNVDGSPSASSGVVSKPGISFGGGLATCARTVVDPANDVTTTKSEAVGQNFELSALVSVGGPRIKLAAYRADCAGSQRATSASWGVGGLTGLTGLPQPIPTGYVHRVQKASGMSLATITFGEVIRPDPTDGSLALNTLHIRFEAGSGVNGEVILGTTACAPTP